MEDKNITAPAPAAELKAKAAKVPDVKAKGGLISAERAEALRSKAKAKVLKERQDAEEAKLLKQFETEERQAGGLEEPLESVFIDLPAYCDRITLDGTIYFQARSYTVPKSRANVMREIAQRTWEHQAQVDGKSENFYRKQRATHVGPQKGSSNLLRA